jgi:hypothetical protein
MNKFAFVAAAALFAGMMTPAFADCDTRKADEDKQAAAASKCYDEYLARAQNYGADKAELPPTSRPATRRPAARRTAAC